MEITILPGSEYIIAVWGIIISTALSSVVAVLFGLIGGMFKQQVLWKTAKGKRIKTGAKGKWPWYLKDNTFELLCLSIGFISTIYCLIGPYVSVLIWLKRG